MTGLVLAAPRAIALTDARTGAEHLVTDDSIFSGRQVGCYHAV
jgi:hypothetical protein